MCCDATRRFAWEVDSDPNSLIRTRRVSNPNPRQPLTSRCKGGGKPPHSKVSKRIIDPGHRIDRFNANAPLFRSRPRHQRSPARSATAIFAPPKTRRHSEARLLRRRISSMLQRPGHHDEAALDVMSHATHHWMRFFAPPRMTANDDAIAFRQGAASAPPKKCRPTPLPLARLSRASLPNVQARSPARRASPRR
jgi:hypothetical protein